MYLRKNQNVRVSILTFALLTSLATGVNATTFNIYVASNGNNTVYEIPDDFSGAAVGSGQIFGNGYTGAYALASLNTDVYVGQLNGQVYRKASNVGGAGTGTLFATATASLYDMDFADSNNLHVAGSASNVQVFNSSGAPQGTYSIAGAAGGIDYAPGDGVYLTKAIVGTNTIQLFTGAGTTYTDSTPAGLAAASFTQFLQQIAKGPDGFLYAADFQSAVTTTNSKIYRVNPTTGVHTNLFPSGIVTVGVTPYGISPVGLDIGPDGKLYFTDYKNNYLFRSALDGSNAEIVATGFNSPTGITFSLVPEPTSFGILSFGIIAVLTRCRRRK